MQELCEIGESLLEVAKTDFSARGVLTQLFPYISEAAKSMSARAISRWLLSTHQVKVSDVTISKALRNPEKHWEAFAEYIEPWARTVENSIEADMESFLSDVEVFNHFASRPNIVPTNGKEALECRDEFEVAVHCLRKNWFSLAPSTRANCERYFHVPYESGGTDAK
jgi:hypothetical protein